MVGCCERAFPAAGGRTLLLLCCLQVELTGLNSLLVQNLSSLSTYLVSVQSHYPQGLSAAIIGNITTRNSPQPLWTFAVTALCRLLVKSMQRCRRCSEGACAFRPEGEPVLGQRDERVLGRCRR